MMENSNQAYEFDKFERISIKSIVDFKLNSEIFKAIPWSSEITAKVPCTNNSI